MRSGAIDASGLVSFNPADDVRENSPNVEHEKPNLESRNEVTPKGSFINL